MAIGDDFEIQADGDIRHVSGTSTYTVLELHRWLQDLAYDSTSVNDDFMGIVYNRPSIRATDQIITLINGYNIDDNAAEYLYGGSITQQDGSVQYSGLQVLGSVNSSTTLNIVQNNTLLTPYWGTGLNNAGQILLQILVKSRTADADIDGKRIRVQARTWGDSYAFFNVTLGEGVAVAAISTVADAQNDSDATSVSAYNVTNTEGYQTIDLNDGQGAEPYYSKWTYNSEGDELKAMYEWAKYVQRYGSSETIHGIDGELFLGITHSYDYDTEAGTAFVEDDVITWDDGTTQGTGLLLALDAAGDKVHMQLLTGEAPIDGQTITNEATTGTHALNGAPTQRTVPNVFLGTYTGTLIGAFGVGVDADDLRTQDEIVDLNGDSHNPPNIVDTTVTVKNESAANIEDARVLIWVTNNDNYFFEASVSITSSGTTATVTHASHGMSTGDYVIISGANEVEYNGAFQITNTGGSSYTYTLPNSTTSPATGTIIATFAVVSGLTNASGVITDSRVWSSNQAISGWVRKSNVTPFYSQGNISGTIDSGAGFSANVQLVGDE